MESTESTGQVKCYIKRSKLIMFRQSIIKTGFRILLEKEFAAKSQRGALKRALLMIPVASM